ncbi:hypothetical protein FACS1894158_15110 [Betaproteobacteria bacterium]|nr:hypothetical protein FACS1894158_15110 [Betaproteobacteria bacterium]
MDAAAALILLEYIGESHQRMTALADVLDWDGLDAEWRRIHPKILELQQIPLDQLTGRERAQAARQIAGLLELEKRISARIGPWMEQVQPLLEVFRKFPLKSEDDAS